MDENDKYGIIYLDELFYLLIYDKNKYNNLINININKYFRKSILLQIKKYNKFVIVYPLYFYSCNVKELVNICNTLGCNIENEQCIPESAAIVIKKIQDQEVKINKMLLFFTGERVSYYCIYSIEYNINKANIILENCKFYDEEISNEEINRIKESFGLKYFHYSYGDDKIKDDIKEGVDEYISKLNSTFKYDIAPLFHREIRVEYSNGTSTIFSPFQKFYSLFVKNITESKIISIYEGEKKITTINIPLDNDDDDDNEIYIEIFNTFITFKLLQKDE